MKGVNLKSTLNKHENPAGISLDMETAISGAALVKFGLHLIARGTIFHTVTLEN